MDPHFEAMISEQAKLAAANPMPALDALPPEMIRAGYRMQRQAQNLNAPKDVETRDLKIDGGAGVDRPEGGSGAPAGVPDAALPRRLDEREDPVARAAGRSDPNQGRSGLVRVLPGGGRSPAAGAGHAERGRRGRRRAGPGGD